MESPLQSFNRGAEIPRRIGSGSSRGGGNKDGSDVNSPELARRRSTRSQVGGSQAPRWKLDQYFKIHRLKGAMKTREYKYHAYPKEEAGYWWGYSVNTLTSEVLYHDIATSVLGLSVIDWEEKAPSRVLDIGTGTGSWVIDLAKLWKETEFIGLDLVPVQTPLNYTQDEDLQARVSWVVANALQGLPFPNDSFDFVHIRMINCGVSESRWTTLLSEVLRVLTPSGRLEIIDTDWSFFGTPKEMMTSDLQDLVSGHTRIAQARLKTWKRKNDKKYDNLGAAVTAMVTRRMINSDPASLFPLCLTALEYSNIGHGTPRHIPILARSSTYRSEKSIENGLSTNASTSIWNLEANDHTFTARPQIGNPLSPHKFHVVNMDVLRMSILVGDITKISEARTLIWEETQNDAVNCQWRSFREFDHEVDVWFKDMIERADMVNLLRSTFDWNEGASRMDSYMQIERETRQQGMGKTGTGAVNAFSQMDEPGFFPYPSSPSITVGGVGGMKHALPTNNGSDDEDQDTIRDGTPTPNQAKRTTAILAFRTGNIFTAQKRDTVL
ncbi:hypothetical protein CBS101457_001849 [Exobasidium rhododendri]|nr:hypothetical protein CBS101457_001849 [Exobasidium rhododendri]